MKKFAVSFIILAGLILGGLTWKVSAQNNPPIPFAPSIQSGTGIPPSALCNNGSLFYNVNQFTWYSCGPNNTWAAIGNNFSSVATLINNLYVTTRLTGGNCASALSCIPFTADFGGMTTIEGPLIANSINCIGANIPNCPTLETGANNAIAVVGPGDLNAPGLQAGAPLTIKLAHSLQAGANTLSFNAVVANIKSHYNPANNIGTAYVSGGWITVVYDGTEWLDEAQ